MNIMGDQLHPPTRHPSLILAQVSSVAQQRARCYEWEPDVLRNGPLFVLGDRERPLHLQPYQIYGRMWAI